MSDGPTRRLKAVLGGKNRIERELGEGGWRMATGNLSVHLLSGAGFHAL